MVCRQEEQIHVLTQIPIFIKQKSRLLANNNKIHICVSLNSVWNLATVLQTHSFWAAFFSWLSKSPHTFSGPHFHLLLLCRGSSPGCLRDVRPSGVCPWDSTPACGVTRWFPEAEGVADPSPHMILFTICYVMGP